MLNGVGGRTIAEAKECISDVEYHAWLQYRRRHGSLNVGLRVETAAALVAFMVHQSAGGKLDYDAFFPVREIDEAVELTKAMETWR
ncbi:hypothetical protein D3C71_1448700 [compost metagenome]